MNLLKGFVIPNCVETGEIIVANNYTFTPFGSAHSRKGEDLPAPKGYERISLGKYRLILDPCEFRTEQKSKCCGTMKLHCSKAERIINRQECKDCGSDESFASEHYKRK